MSHAARKLDNLKTLEEYLQTGYYTPTEIAEYLGCTRMTAHNYLKELEQSHELISEDGKYHLDPTQFVENVRLTQAEAMALYLALRRFIRQTSVTPGFFLSAIQKITNAFRPRDLIEQLRESSESLEENRIATPDQEKNWRLLLQAWSERIPVRMVYQKGKSQDYKTETYDFHPYLFEPAILGLGSYVIGWCENRSALRTFKTDRIQRVTLLTGTFTRREELSPDILLKHAWEVWYAEKQIEVILRFAPAVVPRVLESIWHPLQKTQEQHDGSLIWSVEVASHLELFAWIRGWGHEVEVIAPDDLRAKVADSMRQAAGLYKEEK